eukprot:Ihof_evm6s155 gene=Ihof_evmTU6s155
MARIVIHAASILHFFWEYAIDAKIFIYNIMPTTTLTMNKSPYIFWNLQSTLVDH